MNNEQEEVWKRDFILLIERKYKTNFPESEMSKWCTEFFYYTSERGHSETENQEIKRWLNVSRMLNGELRELLIQAKPWVETSNVSCSFNEWNMWIKQYNELMGEESEG